MAMPVRVTIKGPSEGRIDAPTVDDLIGQIRDFIDVLRSVEKAVEADSQGRIDWRVTDAAMNSPISFEFTPYGDGPAALLAARAERVERVAMEGLTALRGGNARPPFFTDEIITKARRLHDRVLNGLSDTVIAFDADIGSVVIDRPAAREMHRTFQRATAAASIPYREIGSIEGFVTKPELDGFDRAILRFRARLGGVEIKAYASGHAFRQVEELRLSDIWHGVRVRVYGTISYKTLGVIDCINATSIEVMDNLELPSADDIVDPNFTGGLTTEEFLRELRRDD